LRKTIRKKLSPITKLNEMTLNSRKCLEETRINFRIPNAYVGCQKYKGK